METAAHSNKKHITEEKPVETTTCESKTRHKSASNRIGSLQAKFQRDAVQIEEFLNRIPMVGQFFNIKYKIGQGSFSSVFLASLKNTRNESSSKKMFAIKHIIPTTHPERIYNEIKCLQAVGGKDNVIGSNVCMRQGQFVAIITPYMRNDRFRDFLPHVDVNEVRDYMKNLMIALRRVHSFKIIHRDIKPGNFLYDRKNKKFLLIDFGLAHEEYLPKTPPKSIKRKCNTQACYIPRKKPTLQLEKETVLSVEQRNTSGISLQLSCSTHRIKPEVKTGTCFSRQMSQNVNKLTFDGGFSWVGEKQASVIETINSLAYSDEKIVKPTVTVTKVTNVPSNSLKRSLFGPKPVPKHSNVPIVQCKSTDIFTVDSATGLGAKSQIETRVSLSPTQESTKVQCSSLSNKEGTNRTGSETPFSKSLLGHLCAVTDGTTPSVVQKHAEFSSQVNNNTETKLSADIGEQNAFANRNSSRLLGNDIVSLRPLELNKKIKSPEKMASVHVILPDHMSPPRTNTVLDRKVLGDSGNIHRKPSPRVEHATGVENTPPGKLAPVKRKWSILQDAPLSENVNSTAAKVPKMELSPHRKKTPVKRNLFGSHIPKKSPNIMTSVMSKQKIASEERKALREKSFETQNGWSSQNKFFRHLQVNTCPLTENFSQKSVADRWLLEKSNKSLQNFSAALSKISTNTSCARLQSNTSSPAKTESCSYTGSRSKIAAPANPELPECRLSKESIFDLSHKPHGMQTSLNPGQGTSKPLASTPIEVNCPELKINTSSTCTSLGKGLASSFLDSNKQTSVPTSTNVQGPRFQMLTPSGSGQGASFLRVQNSQVKAHAVSTTTPIFHKPHTLSAVPVQSDMYCNCYGKPQVCPVCMKRSAVQARRGGTPGYRPPEVLLRSEKQTTAVDMWAAGVILLSLLSCYFPFFRAPNDLIALAEVANLLGTEKIKKVGDKIGRNLVCSTFRQPLDLKKMCERLRRRWRQETGLDSRTVSLDPQSSCSVCKQPVLELEGCLCMDKTTNIQNPYFPDSAYDLLYRLLDPDPNTRITASEALQHPFILGS